ncbi:hypothetical protein D9M71_794350 [compost metagenome]
MLQCADELAIKLDLVKRQLTQALQRGKPCTKVIDRQPAPHHPQAHEAFQAGARGFQQAAFGQFKRQA